MLGTKPEDFKYKCREDLHRHRSIKSAENCVYCRRGRVNDFRRSARRWFNDQQYRIPTDCHPAVTVLFGEMKENQVTYKEMKKRSGVDTQTLTAWRTRTIPTITNLEACLNVVGLTLVVAKKKEDQTY